jgi:hypothetical protein
MDNTNTMKSLFKLCFCQSIKHARRAVKALEATGHVARTDASGNIWINDPTEKAFKIAQEAIKEKC